MDSFDIRYEQGAPVWVPVSPEGCVMQSKSAARAGALVLDSRSIPCCLEFDGVSWLLLVPEPHLESARRELQLYEEANANWPPAVPVERQRIESTLPTLSILLLLAIFHNLTLIGFSLPGHGIIDFYDLGAAHAGSIRDGQWWRIITALTLHADMVHLLGNVTIGGVFIFLLCQELGSGLSWALLLASGAFGNLVNALVQSPAHRSVGASTAVFAAVGMLTSLRMVRDRNYLQRRWYVPVAAGLSLLAVLGTEGKQTDLGAHLFGFGFGIIFGMAAELLIAKYGRPGGVAGFLLALLSGTLVAAAWWAAVTWGV